MTIQANTLYNQDAMAGLKQLGAHSIDLIIAEPEADTLMQPQGRQRGGHSRMDPSQLIYAYLEQCKRVMKLFNGFFFTSKAFLPVYIAFAQQEGLGWDLVVWEHGGGRQQMVPDSSFIVMLWERGAYFNPDLKQSFFRKVKHHTFSRQEPRSRHPRAKPFRLLEEMILQRSKPGDVVLAPACQGATLPLACERHGRRYIAFQANPKWYAEAAQQLEATPPPAAMGPEGADAPQQMLLNYG